MTADDVRKRLAEACKETGSQRAWAKRYKFSAAYVSDVLLGRREPADAICKALKIKRIVTYMTSYTSSN
jgi:hypothetical protein